MLKQQRTAVPHGNRRRRWRLLAAAAVTGLTAAALTVSPASAATDFGFWVAFQGSNGDLWTMDQTGTPHDIGLGMAPRTNPAAVETCVVGSCPIEAAFQANTGILWLVNLRTGAFINTGVPMAPGTSPSISYTANDSSKAFEVAFQGSNGDLWTYVTGVGPRDTGQPMNNSPSISLPGQFSHPVIAYQARGGGNMCLLTSDGTNSCPGSVMDPASSPSIATVGTTSLVDSVTVAYESADDVLYVYNAFTHVNQRTGLNMAGRTSPGAVADGVMGTDGTQELQIFFQAATSALWLDFSSDNFHLSWTVEGVAAGTSPSTIDVGFDDGTGGPGGAFRGADGTLWVVPAWGPPQPTGFPMAPGTSPAAFHPF